MSHPAAGAVVDDARARWGPDAVRVARATETVGKTPVVAVLQPPTRESVAAMLAWAKERRLTVVPRGGGSKLEWGAPPTSADLILSLARLTEPIEHRAGDLTVTVPAGAQLVDVNAQLAQAGQWLPLDPLAGGRCTIGGLVATNDSGPRRLRHGTPRDLIIGIEMALPDGGLAKAGGRVVKNVAGYDLARLLTGSYGALAVITAATFKLAPVPAASCTVAVGAAGLREMSALAQAIAASPLTPSAIEIDHPSPRLLVRFESTASAAGLQADQLRDLCARHGATATILSGSLESEAWSTCGAATPDVADALLKLSVLPTDLEDVLSVVGREAQERSLAWKVFGRATLGVLFCRLGGSPGQIAGLGLKLRAAVASRSGRVVLLAASPEVKAAVSPWGDTTSAGRVMRAVKAQFDPLGMLCPGGGPGGVA